MGNHGEISWFFKPQNMLVQRIWVTWNLAGKSAGPEIYLRWNNDIMVITYPSRDANQYRWWYNVNHFFRCTEWGYSWNGFFLSPHISLYSGCYTCMYNQAFSGDLPARPQRRVPRILWWRWPTKRDMLGPGSLAEGDQGTRRGYTDIPSGKR